MTPTAKGLFRGGGGGGLHGGCKPKKPFVKGLWGYFLERHETRKVQYSVNYSGCRT